jgi:hypothetical protein
MTTMTSASTSTSRTPLASFLESCASIRQHCSSGAAPTSKRTTKPNLSVADYAQQILDEEAIAKDLERQILDQRAAILRIQRRRQHQQSASPCNSKAAVLREHRLLQSKVLEESARQQKNIVLLQRMAMAQPAKEVAWVYQDIATDDENHEETTEALMGQDYRDWKIMVHETVRCRNNLVTRNLKTTRQLDSLRQKLRTAMQEGEQLQKLTKETWEALTPSEQTINGAHDEQKTDPATKRLESEIVLLKGIVQDLMLAGKLDWYEDERLRETLLKLE